MTNEEIIQEIHNTAKQEFEDLEMLISAAKSLYDEQPEIWQGMDAKISAVIRSIRDLLTGWDWDPRFSYLNLVKNTDHLLGFIDGCRRCNKLDELYVTKIDMSNFFSLDNAFDEYDEFEHAVNIQWCDFGSLDVFDAEKSNEYFSVFLPLLEKFRDENPDLFAVIERINRGASIELVYEE